MLAAFGQLRYNVAKAKFSAFNYTVCEYRLIAQNYKPHFSPMRTGQAAWRERNSPTPEACNCTRTPLHSKDQQNETFVKKACSLKATTKTKCKEEYTREGFIQTIVITGYIVFMCLPSRTAK